MEVNRRQFGFAVGAAAFGVACGKSPTSPSDAVSNPPTGPVSVYGTYYTSNRAGVNGSLHRVLQMANRNPIMDGELLLKFDNRDARPAMVNGQTIVDPRTGLPRRGYFFLVRGERIGSVYGVELAVGDEWVAFDWNGYEFRNS
jgi:hypothetical protein